MIKMTIYVVENSTKRIDTVLDENFNLIEEFRYKDVESWEEANEARDIVVEYGYRAENSINVSPLIPKNRVREGDVWYRVDK